MAGAAVASSLQDSGLKCAVITAGRSIHGQSVAAFEEKGGYVLADDVVASSRIEGGRILSVCTSKLGDIVLEARAFVIATGKFFSKGLVADMHKVYEPVFGLDVEYDEDRSTWFDADFAAHQHFLDFGVKVDEASHPSIAGQTITNLYAVGEIVAGCSCAESDNSAVVAEAAAKVSQMIKEESHAKA